MWDDLLRELAEDVAEEVRRTKRDPREVLDAMRDEGYIDIEDTDVDFIVACVTSGKAGEP